MENVKDSQIKIVFSTFDCEDIDDYEEGTDMLKLTSREITNDDGFLCVGDLGLWSGKKRIVGDLEKCKDLEDVIIGEFLDKAEDDFQVYVNLLAGQENLFIDIYHHDGVNTFLIRKWKSKVSDKKRDQLTDKILSSKITLEEMIPTLEKYTSPITYEDFSNVQIR